MKIRDLVSSVLFFAYFTTATCSFAYAEEDIGNGTIEDADLESLPVLEEVIDYGWYQGAVKLRSASEMEAEEAEEARNLKLMACIIYCEANTEPVAGKQAVGIVTMNRVGKKRYGGNTLEDILRYRGSYPPVDSGWFDQVLKKWDSLVSLECIEAASYALAGNTTVEYDGEIIDLTGITHFAKYIEDPAFVIGKHCFADHV